MPNPFADARARVRHATLDPNAPDPNAEIRRAFGPRITTQVEPKAEQTEPPRPPGRPTEQLETAAGTPASPKPVSRLESGVRGKREPLTGEAAFRRFLEESLGYR